MTLKLYTFTQFVLQNEATRSHIYHNFRPETGYMGLYQNCTCQDSSEFLLINATTIDCFDIMYTVWLTIAFQLQCGCVQLLLFLSSRCPWCLKPEIYLDSTVKNQTTISASFGLMGYVVFSLRWRVHYLFVLNVLCPNVHAENEWVSKTCCDDAGCWAGDEQEGGRETLQSGCHPPPERSGAAAQLAADQLLSAAPSPTDGRELTLNRDGFTHHGWLFLPAGTAEDPPDSGKIKILLSCIHCVKSWGRSFWAGRVNAALAPAVCLLSAALRWCVSA